MCYNDCKNMRVHISYVFESEHTGSVLRTFSVSWIWMLMIWRDLGLVGS